MAAKNRVVRVEEPLWQAAKEAAKENGERITDVILRSLREYVGETERMTTATIARELNPPRRSR